MPNVVVYVRKPDWEDLEQEGFDPAEWVRNLVASALEGRGGVTPGADPAGAVPPRPSSGGIGHAPSLPSRRSKAKLKSGAEPAATGSPGGGEESRASESAPSTAAVAR